MHVVTDLNWVIWEASGGWRVHVDVWQIYVSLIICWRSAVSASAAEIKWHH